MLSGEIKSEKVVFKKVFSPEFWFVVPEYQRSYVWQTDNISELMDDLEYACENKHNNDYFLGSLVLKDLENNDYPEYEVLDGQQRLTTFFIMMAVFRDAICDQDYKYTIQETIYQKENKLKKIPARMRITYKIRDNVETFIKDVLIASKGTDNKELLNEYLKSSNVSLSNMANAVIILKDLVANLLDEDKLKLLEFIFNRAIFIYVSTDNTEDAFRMFSILNNRGIPLTTADILKSENIGELKTEKEIKKYAELWEEIEGKQGERFDRFLQFIRTILIKDKARSNLLDEFHEKIYAVIPPKLKKGADTFNLVNKYNDIYEQVIDLQDDTLENRFKNLVIIMKIGMRSDDWIPPLLYFYKRFGIVKINEFLSKLEYKYTGDWVCGITPTLRLDAMNEILKKIEKADSASEVVADSALYKINIDNFRANLNGDIFKKQYAKFLLLKVEYLLSDNAVMVSNYHNISVEHVLPQNPKDGSQWKKDFNEQNREFWTHKISNLVLLSKKKNSALGNLDFIDKKEKYLNKRIDIFKANKVFMDRQNVWLPDTLDARQKRIVNLLISNT
ncbi:DUF262 domain-containing protein [Clostridium tyrobutyricum]|uniref:RloF n=1 Tax=Clostridium tyrobutyricum DIVETGP TaxID=1408889 RepID=W6N4X7_CLOTY|nr:DUF262 domain-containing protein [Clostridium tyrobutyricum]AND85370.1 hypothetical protein CTK_C21220 [Clostridium tyrobutyricum]ANP69919.1 hypothetical protein BA182_09580 [Clostridium tyrobutyricum]MBV4435732.1 DUF262 domain-containing HNH endonuclease family protein [Clostridium tyrobutyricum]QNB65717.1 DUF262 domain-containing protein [Clostridium tyrobutyricum]CDL91643.1 hypothetical protein CTDIVETGP_1713 [Clostridium tyrobutyricum DIVETGP]